MIVDRIKIWMTQAPEYKLFSGFAVLVLLSLYGAAATGYFVLAGLPVLFLFAWVCLLDFSKIYYLLLFFLPLSTEVYLPGGLGTDLPTEPIIVALMLIFGAFALQRNSGAAIEKHFFTHPIALLLLVHVGWIYATTITSELFLVSLKFSLAKTWYVAVFFFLSGYLIHTERDYKTLFWVVFIPLMFTVLVTQVRHAAYGFSFRDIHKVLHPFQRNHVNYAAMLALFFPFLFLAIGWYRRYSRIWWTLVVSVVVMLVAIYFAYTRAAYVALLFAAGAYVAIRLRLVRYVLAAGLLSMILIVGSMVYNNRYLEYAPNYDRTITHYKFDNLIEATYKMEDISTMERVYRWVAGAHMSAKNPVLGFGPGNFVNFYKPYAVTSFQTYVSNNKENSGIHSYFLMTLVEQGWPGLLLFMALLFYTLIKGENIYHETRDPDRRRLLLMALLCLVVIDAFLLINDMIETDKVGSFFFICLAMLINLDLANRRERIVGTQHDEPQKPLPTESDCKLIQNDTTGKSG
ncbi:MAG: O-antigen ligase family protein [Saprospiraceae bacterium]|nr:O-antigen ligase family protein [Saprospiraceae bacterium]